MSPFVHRDKAIAYLAAIGAADQDALDDVDQKSIGRYLTVQIEDLNYSQVHNNLRDQPLSIANENQ